MYRHVRCIAALAVLAACSKEAPKADSSAVAQAGGATAAPAASYDPATRVATVVASDFAFVSPDTILAGWTTFRMLNNGGFHHMQIVRLQNGKTVADLIEAAKTPGAFPNWAVSVGGTGVPDPKTEANATVNLAPGQYVLLCFVDIPGKVPHFTKGMVRPLTVAASPAAGAEPKADVTVALTDYAFTVKAGALAAGKHTVKIVNDGPQDHEVQLIRLAPGKTFKDFGAWIAKPEGPPPASGLGGIAGLTKGGVGYFDVELSAGNYVLVCFASDAKDKKPHVEHGMLKEFTVQ